jgi:hypothetical protein
MRHPAKSPTTNGEAAKTQEHWRTAAIQAFPEHQEFALSDDEEFGIYNLFFQLREELSIAVARSDVDAVARILGFAGRCIRGELASDGEDIGAAAGVCLIEHIFEDTPRKRWNTIFSAMPHGVYLDCRHYVEQWMDPGAFSKVRAEAKKFYQSR